MPDDARPSYHHGNLRAALLDAGEAELAETGPEAFSLRRVAKRAGVSHAAPAHHFGGARGLLAALATRGFERLVASQDARRADAPDTPEGRLMADGLGYVDFALEHTALFRLCFSSALPDPADPALADAGEGAFMRMVRAVADVTGAMPDFVSPEGMATPLRVWAGTHGIADLMAGGKMRFAADLGPAARDRLVRAMLGPILPRDATPPAPPAPAGGQDAPVG